MDFTSPITGGTVTGLTSPTYTVAADTAPESNQKQWVVTALGGTQTGVEANSIEQPFTLTVSRPKNLKVAPSAIVTAEGYVSNPPKNEYKLITRKGCELNASGSVGVCDITTGFKIPVGTTAYDLVSLKAMLSLHVGALIQDLDQYWEQWQNGTL